jgi:hypothetical protein
VEEGRRVRGEEDEEACGIRWKTSKAELMMNVCERKPQRFQRATRRGKASELIVAERGSGLTICTLKNLKMR